MAEQPAEKSMRMRFDGNDLNFYAGLVLLGTGLAFAISPAVALAVAGAILVVVGAASAWIVLWLSRGK